MIGFVIPIKPKRFSKDWNYDNLLLERTVGSILNQTDNKYKIYIVYSEKPEIKNIQPTISFIHFDFPFLEADEIEDYESFVKKWHKPDYAKKMMDKGRKITLGCVRAKADQCDYIMALDSDDLISNKIVSFVNGCNCKIPGWYINKGFMYSEGGRFVLKNYHLQNINGSTHIIRSDMVPSADMQSKKFVDFNFFEAHGYLNLRIKQLYGKDLSSLPFYGTVYVIGRNNSSNIYYLANRISFKMILKFILRGKYLSDRLRKEFNVYRLSK